MNIHVLGIFLSDAGDLPLMKNILLLDSEGNCMAVEYYSDDWPTLSSKLALEKAVFLKTQKTNVKPRILQCQSSSPRRELHTCV